MLLAALPLRAHAQSPAAAVMPHLAAAPAAAAPVLTPAQAQAVLDVLNDPQKRAQFTATLESMVKVTQAAAPKPPAASIPLAPDSVGAQVIAKSAGWLSELSGQLTSLGQMRSNLPAVWAFTNRVVRDPGTRGDVLDAAWHLALVVALAAAMQGGFRLALRRPVAALAEHAPQGVPDAELIGDPESHVVQRRHRFARTLRALRRLPYMLARLLLGLVPIAAFLMLATVGLNFLRPESRAVLWVAISAYAGATVLLVAARALLSPDHPTLRILMLRGDGPGYTLRWIRRLVAVAAFGYAAVNMGALYGMPDPARLAFIKVIALVEHVFLVIIVLQCRARVAQAIRGSGETTTWRRRLIWRLASLWHLVAIFFIAGLWLVWAAQVHNGYQRMWRLFLVTAGVAIVARLTAVLLLGGIDRVFHVTPSTASRFPGLRARAGRYYPIVRRCVTALIWVVSLLVLLEGWGVNSWDWFRGRALGGQVATAAANVLIALVLCLLVWESAITYVERNIDRQTRQAQLARAARLRTLLPILRTLLFVVLLGVFGLTVLSEIGLNVAPLLAGAGIIGVAIGFGSQKLVQDFITGIFLLLENAMQVGDAVTVAGLSGAVENLSIRTMRLRAGDGSVHIVPFSSVTTVTNSNRGVGNAAVSVSVPFEEDSDHVSDVLAEIATRMRAEPRFADMMRSDLQLWGVDRMDGGIVTIVGQIVCTDGGRWAVQREFNRRVGIRFKDEGIRVALPSQTVFMHAVPPPEPKTGQSEEAVPTGQVQESPPPSALGHGA